MWGEARQGGVQGGGWVCLPILVPGPRHASQIIARQLDIILAAEADLPIEIADSYMIIAGEVVEHVRSLEGVHCEHVGIDDYEEGCGDMLGTT